MTMNLVTAKDDKLYVEYTSMDITISMKEHEISVYNSQIEKLDEGAPKSFLLAKRDSLQQELDSLTEIRNGNKHLAVLDHIEIPKLREELNSLIEQYNNKKVKSASRKRIMGKINTTLSALDIKYKRYTYYVMGILGFLDDSPIRVGIDVDSTFSLNEEVNINSKIYTRLIEKAEEEIQDKAELEIIKKEGWQMYKDEDFAIKKDMLNRMKEVRAIKQIEINRMGIDLNNN